MTITVPFGWANRVAFAKLRPHMDLIIAQPIVEGETYDQRIVHEMVYLLKLATQALDHADPNQLGVRLEVDEATRKALEARRQHLKALLVTGAKNMMHDWLPIWAWLLDVDERLEAKWLTEEAPNA